MDDRFTSTYDDDFLVWSEQQAQALRALKGRADLPDGLDLEHLVEEVEDLGRSEFNGVRNQILNIMIHLIKAASDPDGPAALHWAGETRAFHRAMIRNVTRSMLPRFDLQGLWRSAREAAQDDLADYGQSIAPWVKTDCPYQPEDFTQPRLDYATLLARISKPA